MLQPDSVIDAWTVLALSHRTNKQVYWRCRCKCGTERILRQSALTAGKTKSCGCYRAERLTKHKGCGTPEYRIWKHIKNRCLTPTCKSYPDYGARGITVCDRWRDSFEAFLADMGKRPSRCHTIERLHNDKGYEPGNCVWATRKQQNRNKRSNRRVTVNGVTRCITEWAEAEGISKPRVYYAVKHQGLSFEQAITKEMECRRDNGN